MRLIYSLLMYLLVPVLLFHLVWRGFRAPAYWQRWGERFGFHGGPPCNGSLWIHAVSVGEVQAAVPLIRKLQARYPGHPVVLTTTTPTGSARAVDLFGSGVVHVYVPYDLPGAVARFLRRVQPLLAVIMETEIWPNLFHQCAVRGIPVILANARMSVHSAKNYRRVAGFAAWTLQRTAMIAAQTRQDAERLIGLGAEPRKVRVTGSVKFDIDMPASLREQAEVLRRRWGVNRAVWIAASTHETEEEMVLDALESLRRSHPSSLLVIAPRHPERFARVAGLCRRRGLNTVLHSAQEICDARTEVVIGDTMGELSVMYAAADVAFVGGSLIRHGGQNPLEPAALGIPVLFGPHMFNFDEIARMLIEADAAQPVEDAEELAAAVELLFRNANLRHTLGDQGRRVVEANRGAVNRLMKLIEQVVGQ